MNIDDRPIFLVGFMASGKSTVGKALAKALGWRLLDIDDLVEEREQRSVERIFSESGESFFRQAESEILRSLDDLGRAVVATGGGLFLGYEARRWMLDHGRTVWLDLPLEAARRRVEGGRRSGRRGRPLWEGNDALALRALYQKRRATYALAELRIDATAGQAGEVATRIREALALPPVQNFLDSGS
jgi:shikimate kinase